jgi:cysteinyl-tRNA synthetase
MNKIYLYNTLSRGLKKFTPLSKKNIGVYTCGPTVYNFAHIGNLRSYVFADLLVRTLGYFYGHDKIKWVMNITDVDDKTIRDSKTKYPDLEPMVALQKFTAEYEDYFWSDLKKLNIKSPTASPHAAQEKYIAAMQALIKAIMNQGYAYVKEGSVYFSLEKYSQNYDYGKLVKIDLQDLKVGVRVDSDEYEKDNLQDFVLWKAAKPGEPFWNFSFDGLNLPGRPGWHIECSAMSHEELACPFDIHTGGVDLKFPHHENEIAQSVVGYKQKEPVRFWLHNEFLLVDNQKMGKRFHNFYTLPDIIKKGFKPLALRFLFLQTHYRATQNFTWEGLTAAQNGWEHLKNQVSDLGKIVGKVDKKFQKKFWQALADDLNTPQALAVVQELLKAQLTNQVKLATVLDFDNILGLELDNKVPQDILALARQREQARQSKDFALADELRQTIETSGYLIKDSESGPIVMPK